MSEQDFYPDIPQKVKDEAMNEYFRNADKINERAIQFYDGSSKGVQEFIDQKFGNPNKRKPITVEEVKKNRNLLFAWLYSCHKINEKQP